MTSLPIPTGRRLGRALAGAALVAALVAAGCSGDDGDAEDATGTTEESSDTSSPADETTTSTAEEDGGAAEGIAACELISDELAAEILGVEIVRREATGGEPPAGVSCVKGAERTDDPSKFFYVSVSIIPGGGSTVVDEAEGDADAEPVDGLGERAVFLPTAGVVFIEQDGDALQAQVIKGGGPGSREEVLRVAEELVERSG